MAGRKKAIIKEPENLEMAKKPEPPPLPKKNIVQRILGQPQMLTNVKYNGTLYSRGQMLTNQSVAEYMVQNGFAK